MNKEKKEKRIKGRKGEVADRQDTLVFEEGKQVKRVSFKDTDRRMRVPRKH